jgi:transcriptional regulator
MYINKLNLQKDVSVIERYIKEHGFASIISGEGDDMIATHIPLMLLKEEDEAYLFGHIARPNQQSLHIKNGQKVMAIFMDTHTYISSSWYDHVNVPTWNYMAVHVYGVFCELDAEETISSLHSLVDKYEEGRPDRFHIHQMEEHKFKSQLQGITSFKIKIDRFDAAWKLSQNRDEKNHSNVIKKLREQGDPLQIKIADAMEKDNLYPMK